MRFTTAAIGLIAFIVIFSVFVANVANLVGIDNVLSKRLDTAFNVGRQRWNVDSQEQLSEALKLDDSPRHVLWFLQISDIHISLYTDPTRIPHLFDFCNRTVDIIRPAVVLASGDLTDAKTSNFLGSQQHEQEWRWYRDVLRDTNVLNKTAWLDIRGNHDNFNVPALQTKLDLFTYYSAQGKDHPRSYLHQVTKDGEQYSFIAVDACLDPGPKRPFNFVGMLSKNETQHIINLAERSRALDTNYTIWFGHYPTSCILTPGLGTSGIRNLISKYQEGYAYLCGHFHKLGGAVPQMYTLQNEGFLELELGDWMKNRMYRLAAFDHGQFSFVDLQHNQWPVVLVTNPKNALFNIPGKENPRAQLESTHIRMLVFSPAKITECQVKIDQDEWVDCVAVSRELFVVPWKPQSYARGVHKLSAFVRDDDGRYRVVEQEFTLDGSRKKFSTLARFVLMYDTNKIFQVFFSVALILCLVPLCVFRIWHTLVRTGTVTRPRIRGHCCRGWIRKMWILSTVDRLMFPIIGYCLYLTCGPWSFGEIIDGYVGIVFVWGIFVNGTFLPGTLTYFYGFFQLMLCQFPLMIIYANNAEKRFLRGSANAEKKLGFLAVTWLNLPFVLIMMAELLLAVFFWNAYGTLAFIITPLRTWSIVLNVVLWYQSKNLPDKALCSAAAVWSLSPESKVVLSQ
ncbi:transmembrane protein 62-like isoform X2 [Toxorhynchites rutilus septentrionalis]|nr:transmembrane protein 62-like isoform X2 [Toxorhynchites rutilus septentrionalis]XP_055642132.1 transmembrane protein 62-like isoform X2 [Toxorhynchites rutilus septentrionalis]XP_055642133.1 transmembrane protein 62-like isoform X2 [Toxorhynchites rutilus septentrionalis]